MTSKELLKFAREPGLASYDEVVKVNEFLLNFKQQLEIYRSAYGEPAGYSVESYLNDTAFYLKHSKSKK